MAETRKPVPAKAGKPAKKPAIKADQATINKALAELGINRPYYTCRVVGSRLELVLLGGDVVTWPPEPDAKPPTRKRAPKKS